jgi:hypothetical protein
MFWKMILAWVVAHFTFSIHASTVPQGKYLGGHDIPGVTDAYVIIELSAAGIIEFTGYFQTC